MESRLRRDLEVRTELTACGSFQAISCPVEKLEASPGMSERERTPETTVSWAE